ncbi:MAG: acylphosphatase [Methanocalculus sp.]|uniref:acylphosphatase n=1 Tax=Methanocalculus sp. TaxID=2004547 RepID=UPI00271EB49B|nr:acylphosphatase [Methanocalculus sp.]MDO9539532.1 acylphosphatase [Methanocalculus sp.]
MKRIHAIVDGYVQNVGYREHVLKEAIKIVFSGYVENLKIDEVLIVAEGGEADLKRFLSEIVITRYPMMVTSWNVT